MNGVGKPPARWLDPARRLPNPLIAVVFALIAGIVLYLGRDQVLRGDTIEYASRLGHQSLLSAIFDSPPNKYLFVVPMPVFAGMFSLFGLDADLPYRLVSTALVLGCGCLFLIAARRRIGDPIALALTIFVLLFGPGWETLLTVIRLSSLISIAAGLGAFVLIDRDERRADALAAALLAVSVGSHPGGLAWVAAIAVVIAMRPPAARLRAAWVPLPALAVIAIWLLFLRSPSTPTPVGPTTLHTVVEFAWQAWTVLVADLTGFTALVADPSYDQAAAQVLAAVALAAIVAILVAKRRYVSPRVWGLLLALAITLAAAPLAPGGGARTPDESRYLFPEGVLALLIVVELARVVKFRAIGAYVCAGLLAFAFVVSLDALRAGGEEARMQSQGILGAFAAYEAEGSQADPAYEILGFLPTPEQYRLASEKFGSGAPSKTELRDGSRETKLSFDQTAVGSLGLTVRQAGALGSQETSAPEVAEQISGRARPDGRCTRFSPADGASPAPLMPLTPRPFGRGAIVAEITGAPTPTDAVPQLVELELDGGTLRFDGETHQPGVLIGKALQPPEVGPLSSAMGARTTLSLPDLGGDPWRVLIGSDEPVVVCAEPGG